MIHQQTVLNLAEKIISGCYSLRRHPLPPEDKLQNCKIIAHRGNFSPSATENTLEGFRKCHQLGVWAVEFDIRWTKDGVPVVHHDLSAQRVFGKDLILSELSFEKLKQEVPEIPSLEEVVRELGKKIHLMIEIKDMEGLSQEQIKKFKEVLSPLNPGEDYHIMSLGLEIFDRFPFDNEIKVGISFLNAKIVSPFVAERKWGAFTAPYFSLNQAMTDKHLKLNQKIGTGFIPNENILRREISKNVGWVFTNEAERLQKFLQSEK